MKEKEYKKQMIIAGRGGQGVMFLAELLTNLLIKEGYEIKMHTKMDFSQRGGRVWANIKIGGYNSSYSALKEVDMLILLEGNDVIDHIYYLKEGGVIISNNMSLENTRALTNKYKHIQIFNIDASGASWKVCKSYSNINMAILGELIRENWLPLQFRTIEETLIQKFGKTSKSIKVFSLEYKNAVSRA